MAGGSPQMAFTLCDILGMRVEVAGELRPGRVREVFARLGDDYPSVVALGLRRRFRARLEEIRWTVGTVVLEHAVCVAADADPVADTPPVLPLARDVLDVRVIDVDGRRIGRVGDVELVVRGDAVVVAGVQLGSTPALRRLGLGSLGRRLSPDAVDWTSLHIAGGPGHLMQLDTPSAAVHHLSPEELASLVEVLPRPAGTQLVSALEPTRVQAALAVTHPAVAAGILDSLTPAERTALLQGLDPAAAAAIVARLPVRSRSAVLESVPEAIGRLEGFGPPPRPLHGERRWWSIHRGHGRPDR